MYDEGSSSGDPGGADYGPYEEESFVRKLTYHLEGFIPLILIIIIIVFAGASLGLWQVPFVSKVGPLKMLILGKPSIGTETIINNSEDLVRPEFKSPELLVLSPKENLAQYDVILLDQTGEEKPIAIPRRVGEAIAEWVKKGGKLIIVKNSGIIRTDAPDVIGWTAVFGSSDIAPVQCQRLKNGRPSCVEPVVVPNAEIWRIDYDHPIATFDVIPPIGTEQPLALTTFEVSPNGKQIAAIKDIVTGKFYLGIVEKTVLLGKTIYYNYDPSKTPGVFQNTLRYLK